MGKQGNLFMMHHLHEMAVARNCLPVALPCPVLFAARLAETKALEEVSSPQGTEAPLGRLQLPAW
jgi:hypothetical protein